MKSFIHQNSRETKSRKKVRLRLAQTVISKRNHLGKKVIIENIMTGRGCHGVWVGEVWRVRGKKIWEMGFNLEGVNEH